MNLRKIIEETIMDIMIDEIIDRVLDRLKKLPKKALVIFTEDCIGFEDSLNELKKLKENGWKLKILLPSSVEYFFSKETIKNVIGDEEIEIYDESYTRKIIFYYSDVDKVILPVLNINTLAKISLCIADDFVTKIVANCLMTNIPIVAVKNACDPLDKERVSMGMGKGPIQYMNTIKNYLNVIEGYGIKLISKDEIYDEMVKNKSGKVNIDNYSTKEQIMYEKKLLTRADVAWAFNTNKDLILSTNTIITAAAKDVAKSLGVKMIIQER